MRFNIVLRYIGVALSISALFMLGCAVWSFLNGMDTGFFPLLMGFILTLSLGSLPILFVEPETNINAKEAYLTVIGAWILSCGTGMLPYVLWGGEFNFVNAWFESVSGFTTTGSTILEDIESLPQSLLLWRSSTHWLGGMGVVMFVLIILPSLGRAKMTLSDAQISTLAKDNFRYKSRKVVRILLSVYTGLTLAALISLRLAGMDWFDAVNHAFSTVATGGFSTHDLSIAYFNNIRIEVVIIFFMVISGLHYGLIYTTVTGQRNNVFRSEVSRFYLISLFVAGLSIAISLSVSGTFGIGPALRHGFFHIASITTSTGFATTDANTWPSFAALILIYFSFVCACAGSTSGGIKADRILLAIKSIFSKVRQLQHPNAVIQVKLDKMPQEERTISMVNVFIVLYLLLVVSGTLVATMFGLDLMTAFSVAFSSVSNVGPGFGEIGSSGLLGQMPGGIKLLSTFLMLVGRLEIFGFILIFFYRSWK